MKQLRFFLLLTSLSILFFACQKELSNESGNPGVTSSQWEFSETANFKGNTDTASIEASGGFQTLVIEGATTDGKGEFFLQVFGTGITATTFKNPNVYFEYYQNGGRLYSNVPTNADKFTVVITSLSANSVSGTFSGEVEDSTNNLKQVVNGKFTAPIKQAAPAQGICKLQTVAFSDPVTSQPEGAINYAFNSSHMVTRIQAGLEYNLSYTAGRVTIDTAQYFSLDGNGRITSFNGYIDADPTSSGTPRVKISYTYDANGYMTKASYAFEVAPTVPVQEIAYTWTGGNLAKVVTTLPGRKEKVEIDYVYDASKTPKINICLFPNYEITFFQAAIYFGKNSANLVTSSKITEYDINGVNTGSSESKYINYTEDANKYIKSFEITGKGNVLAPDTKYTLSYHCY